MISNLTIEEKQYFADKLLKLREERNLLKTAKKLLLAELFENPLTLYDLDNALSKRSSGGS
jgi:hypothetical protein